MHLDIEAKLERAELMLMLTDETELAYKLFQEIHKGLKSMNEVPTSYVQRFVWIAERIRSRR
jgi:hypothetical protein